MSSELAEHGADVGKRRNGIWRIPTDSPCDRFFGPSVQMVTFPKLHWKAPGSHETFQPVPERQSEVCEMLITFRRFSYNGDVLVLEISQVMETREECLVMRRRGARGSHGISRNGQYRKEGVADRGALRFCSRGPPQSCRLFEGAGHGRHIGAGCLGHLTQSVRLLQHGQHDVRDCGLTLQSRCHGGIEIKLQPRLLSSLPFVSPRGGVRLGGLFQFKKSRR
jgi:hypothetical protein